MRCVDRGSTHRTGCRSSAGIRSTPPRNAGSRSVRPAHRNGSVPVAARATRATARVRRPVGAVRLRPLPRFRGAESPAMPPRPPVPCRAPTPPVRTPARSRAGARTAARCGAPWSVWSAGRDNHTSSRLCVACTSSATRLTRWRSGVMRFDLAIRQHFARFAVHQKAAAGRPPPAVVHPEQRRRGRVGQAQEGTFRGKRRRSPRERRGFRREPVAGLDVVAAPLALVLVARACALAAGQIDVRACPAGSPPGCSRRRNGGCRRGIRSCSTSHQAPQAFGSSRRSLAPLVQPPGRQLLPAPDRSTGRGWRWPRNR